MPGLSKPPKKIKNIERRSCEYSTPVKIEKLISAAKQLRRYGTRDSTMILMAYRHGFRISELIALKWSHSTGFKLANDGQDTRSIQHYLGHKNIQHTVRYTEVASTRFKEFWQD